MSCLESNIVILAFYESSWIIMNHSCHPSRSLECTIRLQLPPTFQLRFAAFTQHMPHKIWSKEIRTKLFNNLELRTFNMSKENTTGRSLANGSRAQLESQRERQKAWRLSAKELSVVIMKRQLERSRGGLQERLKKLRATGDENVSRGM